MTTLAGLYNWVIPEVGGADQTLVDNALRDACIEFFRRSWLWREDGTDIAVLAPVETTTTTTATAGATSVDVASVAGISAGDIIFVKQTDQTIHRTTAGTATGLTLPLATALAKAVDNGASVSKVTERYTLSVGTGTQIAEVMEAWLDQTKPLTPIMPGKIESEYPDYRTQTGAVERFTLRDDNTIQLVRIPEQAGVLSLKFALTLSPTGTSFPDWAGNRYYETLAAGAKFRLMRMPRKPWSSADLARFYLDMFERGIADATVRAAKGNARAPMRTVTMHSLPPEDDDG